MEELDCSPAIFLFIHGHTNSHTKKANSRATPKEMSAIAQMGSDRPSTADGQSKHRVGTTPPSKASHLGLYVTKTSSK